MLKDVAIKGEKVSKIAYKGKIIYQSGFKIKPFATCTDDEIKQYLDLHYAGKINIGDYWHVGDTRKIHLNNIANPNKDKYTDTWPAQDITIVITAFNHHDLATPINGITKTAITVQTREVLNNLTDYWNVNGCVFTNLSKDIDVTFAKWSKLPLRTWMNGTFLTTCFSSNWKNMIKSTKHKRLTQYNAKTTESVTDKIFLPSYPEIFGNISNTFKYLNGDTPTGEEGIQWEYYKIAKNRIKKGNNNGKANSVSCYWLNGSANSDYDSNTGYHWCDVTSRGEGQSTLGQYAYGLAPAFCL